ncbi:hypothetical protein E4U60_006198 [Claviceps pazoutovae]|uniref:Uncharacterized protein n=1 Tax=Claviceps pazoutovae TaxID=1649127 RepID=A0A9P7SDU7_9HYPO|nr:hypothetical protein E4U60_006198 [Claviceps pazoutovae]
MTQSREWGTIMETISLCARTVHQRAGKTIRPGGCRSIIQGSRYELEHRWHWSLDTDHVKDMKSVFGMDGPKRMSSGNRLLSLYNGADTARRYEVVRLKPLLASTPLANSILLGI